MTSFWRYVAAAWLALGTLVFVHGAMTGSGLAGVLLYHQLVASQDVSPTAVSGLLLFPLCVLPLVILLATRDRSPTPPQPAADSSEPVALRRALLLGGLFGGAVALLLRGGRSATLRLAALLTLGLGVVCLLTAAWDLLENGNPLDYVPQINLDTEQAIPPVREASVTGTIHPSLALAYRETGSAKGVSYSHAHGLVPLTSAAWRLGQPVRVLADITRTTLPADGDRFTQNGFVSHDVPGYVRHAFADRGVTLDDDVVVVRTEPDSKVASVLLAIGVIALAMGFALAAANRSTGNPPPAR